jgi:hypothetical protein
MKEILNLWDLPAFKSFIPNGYTTQYIPGTDLHGNQPFGNTESPYQTPLDNRYKPLVSLIYENANRVGQLLGYTLGDITCGNMLIYQEKVYLIDYEVIIDYPLSETYINIWNNTQQIIFGK